jgi:hypothetical protein
VNWRAFILAPLLTALPGCVDHTHPDVQPHHPATRAETPIQVAPDARISPCFRFARSGKDLQATMWFRDGGRLIQLEPGEECRTTQGYLMGVEK